MSLLRVTGVAALAIWMACGCYAQPSAPANYVGTNAGGICQPCQDRIRREAMGEQAGLADRAEREIARQGDPFDQEMTGRQRQQSLLTRC